MKIYAIGDLHLATDVDKPMNIFGPKWHGHQKKIIENWKNTISSEDVVLIPGDISWGMRLFEAQSDLKCIDSLPGKKILIRGNHDYWWEKITHLNTLYKSIYFLQNTSVEVAPNIWVCGSRGWICPGENTFDPQDEKIYLRECQRLTLSLEHARQRGAKQIIVLLHYPPTNNQQEPSLFTELITSYPVTHVVYGHLHDEQSHLQCLQGIYNARCYHLVAADYLNFTPKEIVCLNEERTSYELTNSI